MTSPKPYKLRLKLQRQKQSFKQFDIVIVFKYLLGLFLQKGCMDYWKGNWTGAPQAVYVTLGLCVCLYNGGAVRPVDF